MDKPLKALILKQLLHVKHKLIQAFVNTISFIWYLVLQVWHACVVAVLAIIDGKKDGDD